MPFRLIVPQLIYDEMVAQAIAELPNECCGLLAGVVEQCSDEGGATVRIGRIVKRYPLVNEAKSPVLFFDGGKDLFAAARDMRELSLETLVVYHSHPTTHPIPSKTDLANHYWGPDVMCLILSLQEESPRARGWWLSDVDYREAEWEVV
jgi:proteasome lid subunit RPN8/RPN11